MLFGVDNSFVHTNNRKKDILVLGKGSTNWLGDTTITVEAETVFVCLILHYVGSSSYLFFNGVKIWGKEFWNKTIWIVSG